MLYVFESRLFLPSADALNETAVNDDRGCLVPGRALLRETAGNDEHLRRLINRDGMRLLT